MGVRVNIDGIGIVEFDDNFKDLSEKEQQNLVNQVAAGRRGTRTRPSGQDDASTDPMDFARAAMQGVMFGFSDEAAGLFRGIYDAATEGKPFTEAYTEARDKARKNLDDFRKDDPLAAYGTEIIASLPTALLGGAGLARTGAALAGKGLGAATRRAGVEGAIYGAGAGEGDVVDQTGSALLGGATGAALTGAVGGAARKIGFGERTADAQELVDKGVKLTMGQQQPSSLLGFAENYGLSSLPILGPGVKAAQREAVPEFTSAAFQEALDEIGKTGALKKIAPENAFDFTRRQFGEELDRLLPNLELDKLKSTVEIQDLFNKKTDTLAPAARDEIETFLNAMNARAQGVTSNKLDGKTFQAIDSDFATKIRNTNNNEIRIFLQEARDILRKNLDGTTPKAKEDYAKYKRGYAKFVVNRTAAAKRGEIFTPAQLRAAARQKSPESVFAAGEAFMQPLAKSGENVLQSIADSGTAIRMQSATNPVEVGKALGLGLLSEVYRPVSRTVAGTLPPVRRLLIDPAMPATGIALPGLLGAD